MSEFSDFEQLLLNRIDRLEVKVDTLVADVAALKAKAGLWGAVVALIVSVIVAVLT
tara:strand:- start:41 stop:208 length:168 start_codon:yes stop_codon:yes gene_type:complete